MELLFYNSPPLLSDSFSFVSRDESPQELNLKNNSIFQYKKELFRMFFFGSIQFHLSTRPAVDYSILQHQIGKYNSYIQNRKPHEEHMKFDIKKTFLILFILEGLGAISYYFSFHAESGSARLFHQSTPRLLLAALLFLVILLACTALISLFTRRESAQNLADHFDRVLVGETSKLHLVQLILFCIFIAAVEGFFLTFISFRHLCAHHPVAGCRRLAGWLFLRISYKEQYTPGEAPFKPNGFLFTHPASGFLVLSIIGLVYFCVFIPLNSLGWNDPNRDFMSGLTKHPVSHACRR